MKQDVFKNFGHGFIILKLVEITGNDNGMVVFSGDVHLRFERYFRCNDHLMSCPFLVPICERLAFNVFPCHTSLFLEPCEWQESHMNLISRVFNHSNGTRIHTWVCQEVSNYIEEWKEEAGGANEQMSRPHSSSKISKPVSLAVGLVWGIFTKRPCCGNLLPMQFSHYAPKLDEPYLYQCCTYSFFIHPVVQYGCKQICQPFLVTPEVGSFYGRFLAFKAWVPRTWSDFFLHLVFLVEDCHMFV